MDNNNIFFTQKKFDEVWGRVTSKEPCSDDILKTMMGHEFSDMHIYSALAQKYTGELRTRFTQMANDEKQHFLTLYGQYYILTGKRYIPEKPKNITLSPINAVLRQRYDDERAAYAGYMKAADETASKDMAALFRCNAADEEKHMRTVLELLGKVLR